MKAHPESVKRFLLALKASGKSPSTIESYCRDAADFLLYLNDCAIRTDEVEPETLLAYQAQLGSSERDNSVRRKIIGIRQFFRFLADEDRTYTSPLDHVPIPERDESLPEGLADEDIDEILLILKAQPKGIKTQRDLAILHLLAFEGLKATEVINLKWTHLFLGAERATMQLHGNRSRTIELSPTTFAALTAYRDAFTERAQGFSFEKESLFISFKGRDFATILPKMSRHGLKFLVYELGHLAGIKHLNTELLRHYAVQFQLGLGKSPGDIMAHFGLRRLGNIGKHAQKWRRQEEQDNSKS
ncbi:tyrosine-type recombinase/integrase [Pseudobacteriovorax antillogorgiicola]|uniref:Site-specific recombinase XerD n=1 Tax=Pseudobacteriovorax antillogorgiicola TaxID=1513793 RepID=A0A1Y6B8Y2_9BACT|nr:site-specific integrase [Pseudobacteriovorax antillogorgiicola]TCS59478.1 site-specific recombinase XerD [Pseudobacteriovorax antillogorgiicola]SME88009.1 Site-specific recombinase XerD [Pseudobacteriovorax antillogorgiicola]